MAIEFKQADKPKKANDRRGIVAIDSFEDVKQEPPRPDPPKATFNRNAYQAQYMRWKRAADKLGMTVAQYRKEREK